MVEAPPCVAGALADVIQKSERVLVQFERMRSQLDGLVRDDGLPMTRTAINQLTEVVQDYQQTLGEVKNMAGESLRPVDGQDELSSDKQPPQMRLQTIQKFRRLAYKIQQQIEDLKNVFWLEVERMKVYVRWQQRIVRGFTFDLWMLLGVILAWCMLRWSWTPVEPVQ